MTEATVGPVRRALISTYDKRGIVEFARGLAECGVEILSTGGTARTLRDAGLDVLPVEEVTGFPEILDGRVKTLHPAIHAGILARRDRPEHMNVLQEHELTPIDLVCVNLYPFEEAARGAAPKLAAVSAAAGQGPDDSWQELLEFIDIGGPTLIRAAAKNHAGVFVVVDPADYPAVLAAVRSGDPAPALRRALAARAFAHTAYYDAVIAGVFAAADPQPSWPDRMVLPLVKARDLRYGENPHQSASLYAEPLREAAGLAGAEQLQGKELSYNNLQDTAAAWELVQEFDAPAAVAIKHMNPCGAAVAQSPAEAFRRAREADPVSIFGGIIAFNRPLDGETAELLTEQFLEVVIAPEVNEEARSRLAKRKNLRVLVPRSADDPEAADDAGRLAGWAVRSVPGGLLVQSQDDLRPDPSSWRTVTGSVPPELQDDLLFAWSVVKHVKSNAIVVARDGRTLGVGAGQMNRVEAARIALEHAGERARGAVMVSDAFLPFPDTVEWCARYGIAVLVQPGGSLRDEEVIEAAERLGVAMVFTGVRHFRH